MSDNTFQEIDFSRYQRWLNRAVGAEAAFMVFDKAGTPLWGKDTPQATELGLAIAVPYVGFGIGLANSCSPSASSARPVLS